METWSAHHLFQEASKQLDCDTIFLLQNYALDLRSKKLPVIFSLGHLGKITGIDYDFLYRSVNRKYESINYNMFSIRKRSGGNRFIHAVNGRLFKLQKYLNEEILQKIYPHPSSFAFHVSGGIRQCANQHCGCRWLFQFDLKDFFYTIAEPHVFKIFKEIGYKKILAFELARLCTTIRLPKTKSSYIKYNKYVSENTPYFPQKYIGVLPQGAPTSPMLSNLAARRLDEMLYDYSQNYGLVYTRYADDLAFSASVLPPHKSIARIKRDIITIIRRNNFFENNKKIRIAGPGSRKTILGLLVDGEKPRLTKQLRNRIEWNIYSIEKFGISEVANHDKFESVYGFFNHLSGLMSFIHDVDLTLWNKLQPRFATIKKLVEL